MEILKTKEMSQEQFIKKIVFILNCREQKLLDKDIPKKKFYRKLIWNINRNNNYRKIINISFKV